MDNINDTKRAIITECRTQAIFAGLVCVFSCIGAIFTCIDYQAISGGNGFLPAAIAIILPLIMSAASVFTGRITINNIRNIVAIAKNKFSLFRETPAIETLNSIVCESFCIGTCNIQCGNEERTVRFEMPSILEIVDTLNECLVVYVESTKTHFVTATLPSGTIIVSSNVFVRRVEAAHGQGCAQQEIGL